MALDVSSKKLLDRALDREGLKLGELKKQMEAPIAMPPLPSMDVLRGAGAIPLEENTPQPETPARPAAKTLAPADDKAPPPPLAPKLEVKEAKPDASPLPANAPKPAPKAPSKSLPR